MLQGLINIQPRNIQQTKAGQRSSRIAFSGMAQSFGQGGAIVYEYEKDDDYDEEDPYEDPF